MTKGDDPSLSICALRTGTETRHRVRIGDNYNAGKEKRVSGSEGVKLLTLKAYFLHSNVLKKIDDVSLLSSSPTLLEKEKISEDDNSYAVSKSSPGPWSHRNEPLHP